jgi:AcrR family transcriptional regulator
MARSLGGPVFGTERVAALLLLEQYDALGPVRDQAEKHLVAESHKHPITRVLESVPGIGEVRAAQVVSVVVTPDRFRTRAQFWSYSGTLRRDYDRLLAAGTKPNLAKLTLARKIAAITLALWKTKEKYDPHKTSKPTELVHYFGDKDGLYRAVLEHVLATMVGEGWRVLETFAPPKQRPAGRRFSRRELSALVDAFVGMLVDFYSSHAHVLRILRDESVRGGSVGDALVKTHLRPQLDDIVARFEAMKAAGEVRADVDTQQLCISTVAMTCFPTMDEAFLGALWGIDPRSPEFIEARKREVATTVLGRIAP